MYGPAVRTLDFESNSPGSNPGTTYIKMYDRKYIWEIANMPERSKGLHSRCNVFVLVGSSPTISKIIVHV